eukprot:CAMPEP_0171145938 /NCGR_PEP_ID=MMETSP0766_2-20121228/147315_1 /TAXON_ID=439317 /ORGANISM="Gambierdiscus australes, Strain CAWD 149" /LENGTH=503 /DNA_ID=CAMNT_0011609843 /DNA_START=51 /DNA_END=1562 /DNA_ORIENTATION=-
MASDMESLLVEVQHKAAPASGTFASRRIGTCVAMGLAVGCPGLLLLTLSLGSSGKKNVRVGSPTAGLIELTAGEAACASYEDCALLEGNCCPTDGGAELGCCNSPKLTSNASILQVLSNPPTTCQDTPGWTNGNSKCWLEGHTLMQGCTWSGLNCKAYEVLGYCAEGVALPGKDSLQGDAVNNPELNCCACGKAPTPDPAPATVNSTQGEPSAGDCKNYAGCNSLGIVGDCCPTASGLLLGCCSELGASEKPAVLPPAKGPGKLMTFYMYRVANDEDYPINGVNMANLAGDMWYLHNEVVQHCPRKFNMERLLRFKVSMRATPELLGQGRNFDAFVAMDQAKCTVPMCTELHWDPYGYVVGCQPNNVGQVAVPGSPVWYSLPGTCPSKFYYEKTASCNVAEPGGRCPTSNVTGARNCTYHLEHAGEIRLDELSGLTDYNKVCAQTGVREYDIFLDMGVGTKFWNGKTTARAGRARVEAIEKIFAQKFPDMPATLDDPVCDIIG